MSRLRLSIALLSAIGVAATMPAIASAAESPTEKLKIIQRDTEQALQERDRLATEARLLAAEIEALRRDSIAAAEAERQHEAALSSLEDQLQALTADEAEKKGALGEREKDRAGLLMSLARLARNPPEALALSSSDPVAAERSALLIGQTVPLLDKAARELSSNLKQLAALRTAIGQAQEKHRAEQNSLTEQQARLAAFIARKAELQQRAQHGAEATGQQLAKLGEEAANLKELIEKLEADRKKREADAAAARAAAAAARAALKATPPLPGRPGAAGPQVEIATPALTPPDPSKPANIRLFRDARGKFLTPAAGRLVRDFGQPDPVGMQSKGMTYETRAGAQVVAPFDGRVLFAGPFRGYGQILIIEHGDGYHSLLAGLDKIQADVGQWLVAGEPVGTMPEGEEKPRLYLELRLSGQPVNPLPWLATSSEKVSG